MEIRRLLVIPLTLFIPIASVAQEQKKPPEPQLPAEIQGAKVYRLPDEDKAHRTAEDLVIYKTLRYEDINLERLVLRLSLAIKPVDRDATVQKVYFQDIRANGIPIHVETFDQEFKLSKKESADLPAPLKCTILFNELDSVAPLKEIVNQDDLKVTGQSFLEIKLSSLQKLAVRAKRLVLPVQVNQSVPLEMFAGNPLLKTVASGIIDALSDPSNQAAIALAKEHVAKIAGNRVVQKGQSALYLVYTEYVLRDPKTGTAETFSQSGTGFLITSDGKMLTAKRVIEPWKFDPQSVALISRDHMELDTSKSTVAAWRAGTAALNASGSPNLESAVSTRNQTLKIIEVAPDKFEKQEVQDPNSGEKVAIEVHSGGANDIAVLQITGAGLEPLKFVTEDHKLDGSSKLSLAGFPFGLSQPQASPKVVESKATMHGETAALDQNLNPGQSGAPLLTNDGSVVGMCSEPNVCVWVDSLRKLIH